MKQNQVERGKHEDTANVTRNTCRYFGKEKKKGPKSQVTFTEKEKSQKLNHRIMRIKSILSFFLFSFFPFYPRIFITRARIILPPFDKDQRIASMEARSRQPT